MTEEMTTLKTEQLGQRIAELEAALKQAYPVGATCATCGFRYFEKDGHIIACPVCKLTRLEAASPISVEEVEKLRCKFIHMIGANVDYGEWTKLCDAALSAARFKQERDELRHKLGDLKACFLGIDQQVERLLGPPPISSLHADTWKDEDIIVGYKLNTGLWHRIHGLLAGINAVLKEQK